MPGRAGAAGGAGLAGVAVGQAGLAERQARRGGGRGAAGHDGDRPDQGGLALRLERDVVGQHLDQGVDRLLRQPGGGQPRQRLAPRGEGPQQKVVALAQVGVLVNQHGTELIGFQGGHEAVGEDRHGPCAAGQAVRHGRVDVEDHRSRAVGGRRGQEVQQFAVAPALALDLVVGQQQGEHQVGRQQGRGRERKDVPEAQFRGGGIVEDHARQGPQAGEQVVPDRLEPVDQHGADHGQATGQGDRLPQQHRREGGAGRPLGTGKEDRHRPRQCYRQDRQKI